MRASRKNSAHTFAMRMRQLHNAVALILTFMFCGCASVRVTSDPPGARVFRTAGSGPYAMNWDDPPRGLSKMIGEVGRTPISFRKGWQVEAVKVLWDDGLESPPKLSQQDFWGSSPVSFHFTKLDANQTAQVILPSPRASLPPVTWSPENIAVADLTAYTLSQGEAKTLTEKLHSVFVQTEYFNVLSRSDMKTVLETQHFQRSDACDDSACLVEMGKILAVQKIVGGSVGKVGTTFSLSLRLVNVETGKTEITSDRQLKAEPDELLGLVREAAEEMAIRYAKTKQK